MYTHIFFDLDGTLTDPKEGITNSVAYALASFGIHEDPDRLTPFLSPSRRDRWTDLRWAIEDSFPRLIERLRHHDIDS